MTGIIEAAKVYFKDAGWEYDDSDESCLEFFRQFGPYECGGLLEDGMILGLVFFPYIIPQEVREEVIDFVNAINASLFFGNLELDEDTGILKLRHGFKLPPGSLTEAMVDCILKNTVEVADEVFPLVMQVVSGEYGMDEEVELGEMEEKMMLN